MLCVIAKVDDAATQKLISLSESIANLGFSPKPIYGHITLISYLGPDEADFIQQCKEAVHRQHSFTIMYDRIEVLSATSIVVVSLTENQALKALHLKLYRLAPHALDIWSSLDVWQPHTTLLYHPQADLEALAKHLTKRFTPFAAQIKRIEFSKVTEEGYQIVDTTGDFPLL